MRATLTGMHSPVQSTYYNFANYLFKMENSSKKPVLFSSGCLSHKGEAQGNEGLKAEQENLYGRLKMEVQIAIV